MQRQTSVQHLPIILDNHKLSEDSQGYSVVERADVKLTDGTSYEGLQVVGTRCHNNWALIYTKSREPVVREEEFQSILLSLVSEYVPSSN